MSITAIKLPCNQKKAEMIKTQNQLIVAKEKAAKLAQAVSASETTADQQAYSALLAEIEEQIQEYEDIRARRTQRFMFDNVDQLGDVAIKARLARGVTQRELAERLDVSEQVIQRYEAKGYDRSSIDTVAEVFDALGYAVEGFAAPLSSDFVSGTNMSNAVDAMIVEPVGTTIAMFKIGFEMKTPSGFTFQSAGMQPLWKCLNRQPELRRCDDPSGEIFIERSISNA
jgi:transcriptional regulator with XRE-family HTH domain